MAVQSRTSESEWLRQAIAGDSDAFSRLVELYLPRVYSVCLKLMGHKQDAEDCAQDTFVKIWNSLESFRHDSTFYTWVYRIAVNTCRDLQRSQSRHQLVSLDEEQEEREGSSLIGKVQDNRPLPDEMLEREETNKIIRQAILKLPEEMSEILILRDLQMLTYQEIGQMLELAEGTVKSRLHRARKILMKELSAMEQINGLRRPNNMG